MSARTGLFLLLLLLIHSTSSGMRAEAVRITTHSEDTTPAIVRVKPSPSEWRMFVGKVSDAVDCAREVSVFRAEGGVD